MPVPRVLLSTPLAGPTPAGSTGHLPALSGLLTHSPTSPAIPDKADQARNRKRLGSRGGRPPKFDAEDHKDRHVVECGTNRLKRDRSVATRYDELAAHHEATVLVAVISEWL